MKTMNLPISEKYFDPLEQRDLVEDFMSGAGVSGEVLQFATDYYGVSDGVEAIIDYYDLSDDFEEYLKENWSGYNDAPDHIYNYNLRDGGKL